MGTYSASLRAIGDVKTLPATVEISDGRLTIAAGSTEIGSWSLDEVTLEEIPTGYRMAAEGDQILIELKDVSSFAAALATGSKKKRRGIRKGDGAKAAAPAEKAPIVVPPLVARRGEVPSPKSPARAAVADATASAPRSEKGTKRKVGSRVIDFVDTLLIKAKKRFGAYLPDFVFSRALFSIAIGVIALMIVLPGVFSMILLIAGALIVMFGAVVYTDSVLASRFLPGRSTPQQALILGVSVLLLGVLFGAIAR